MTKTELRKKLIKEYKSEIRAIKEEEETGDFGWVKYGVSASTAGEELARGRKFVPIEEYRTYWEMGLKALKHGADPTPYNY